MDTELSDCREELLKMYRERLDVLKPLLMNYLKRIISGDSIGLEYVKEYAHLLMYHQVLKNPKDETIGAFLPIMDRFNTKSHSRPETIELSYIVYRLLSFDYHKSKFIEDKESPNTPFGLYM